MNLVVHTVATSMSMRVERLAWFAAAAALAAALAVSLLPKEINNPPVIGSPT